MERELIATGIGGQGVQLAAQVLARAAVADGLEVLLFGSYGGMMRGGNTDAALVFSPERIESPPVVPACWLGLAMHHAYLEPLLAKLRPDSVLFTNSSVVLERPEVAGQVVEVPATDVAVEVGSLMCASIVMVGAVAAATGLLSAPSLDLAVHESLPSYRARHAELNVAALAAGARLVTDGTVASVEPAWGSARV
jgi:2-oxoglutarate ferredoxin oxidoreductase subunit gamma